MKVGDKVIVDGSDHVYKIKELDKESNIATVVSIYTDRHEKFRLQNLKPTVKTPAILVETYGQEWRDHVKEALDKAKVRYKHFAQERARDITKFFVDAKKVSVAQKVLDEYYKNGLDAQHGNTVIGEPLTQAIAEEEVDF